jgi:hypothetical protein
MNHKEIKRTAKEAGCRATDLIVLAPRNDPFYIGSPATIDLAYWFKDLWERFGYTGGVHLRRIHYQIISQENPVFLPNGKPYINTNNCWSSLDCASKYARYLKLVDPGAFDDRRNAKPIINMEDVLSEPDVETWNPFEEFDFRFPSFPMTPYYSVDGYIPDQGYHLEVWAEKTTMNDILEPLCENYKVNLITGVGELSITSVQWLFNRLAQFQKPCRIFYISDFDPAGQSIPVAVSRKIEKFMHDSDTPFNIRLFPLVLSHEQCIKYRLPRTPIKESELRAGKFEERFGSGATELDALESLYLGELRKIITDVIRNYRDDTLDRRVFEVENNIENQLGHISDEILMVYNEDIRELKNEYNILKEEFEDKIAGLSGRISNVWQAISDEMEEAASDEILPPVPKTYKSEEIGDGLYNSDRNYFEQLKEYKAFQGKPFFAMIKL